MATENNQFWDGLESLLGDESVHETTPSASIHSNAASNRQILLILFVIDVSGSMTGVRIAQVNYAMENICKELRQREDLNAEIKIGIMEFADRASWVTPKPVPVSDFVFTQIETQPWYTNYAAAFNALEQKLHSKEFMDPRLGDYFAPLILFITDGEPMDVKEYPIALEALKKNRWFKKSSKYAIATGEESKSEEVARTLTEFTGERKNVRYADEGAALCGLIEFIAVRASEVQSSLSIGDSGPSGKSIFTGLDGAEPDNTGLWSSIFKSSV